MRAGRIKISTREFEVVDHPIPEPSLGQVRLQVKAAGVCLSDVHLLDSTLSPGYLEGDEVTIGHEVSGIIDVLGIFYDATLEFSATKYATISIVLPVFYNLKHKLKFHSTDSSFKKFLKSILNSSLNFYFDQYVKCNLDHYVAATFLDNRKKMFSILE